MPHIHLFSGGARDAGLGPPRSSTAQWGVLSVKGNMEERAQELALYIIENKATVRSAANRFGISKSTVHMDIIKQNGTSG